MFNNWSKWEDVCVRSDNRGQHYLLQQSRDKKNRVRIRNLALDKRHMFDSIQALFHGGQNIDRVLKLEETT